MNSIEYPRLDLIAATLFAFIEYQLFDGFMMKLSKVIFKIIIIKGICDKNRIIISIQIYTITLRFYYM